MVQDRDDEAFLAGVGLIYAEHRQITERIEALDAAITSRRPEDMRSALRFLMGDLVEHWATEERFMATVGYPFLDDHQRLHALIQDRVMEARQAGFFSTARLAEAATALARAVEDHVKKDDLRLAAFIAARERLRALAGAGAPEAPGAEAVGAAAAAELPKS